MARRKSSRGRSTSVRATASPSIDAAFAALADATRRDVVRLLVGGPRRPSDMAAALGVSPPALSRHLRVLRRSRLVVERGLEDDARVRVYGLNGAAIADMRGWLERVESMWSDQLEAFKAYAEAAPTTRERGR